MPFFHAAFPRWQQLITPAWLARLMAGASVSAAPANNWRLFEVDCGTPAAFLKNHIPGAAYLDTHSLEEGPFWNKVPDSALLQLLLGLGIRHDTTVILYGRNTTAAARAAHLMLYAGVKDVRLLDGGFDAWLRAALPCADGVPQRHPPATSFGAAFPGCPQYLINTHQARSLLSQPDGALASIRTWDEFTGKTSGYSYIKAKGDIPGARWGRAGNGADVNNMSEFHRPDGTMRPAREICQFWRKEGIHPGRQTAFYCGTGWRASVAFYYAWLMGWERISVYDGGWFEWSHGLHHEAASRPSLCAQA
ncbi:MAG: rhodanese-like domain-containing protein [Polaromonas sp.]|uniref:sulfurtransferase n=1 Tax=Polaromonas sp. TaxID=1869339 RepID=UPI002733CF27|nr:rhodanese-like domain-containing protein [Polaromonas sp.]MDP3798841.1 rhodanese-like domain-containing protein [Polaromonas sp.]